jgi:hypothetical protein
MKTTTALRQLLRHPGIIVALALDAKWTENPAVPRR